MNTAPIVDFVQRVEHCPGYGHGNKRSHHQAELHTIQLHSTLPALLAAG